MIIRPQKIPKINLFVYGSLLFDEVLQTVIKRIPTKQDALLRNYKRFAIKNEVYPGIIFQPDSFVQGKILKDISQKEKEILDKFEEIDKGRYQCLQVKIQLLRTSQSLPQQNEKTMEEDCWTYVFNDPHLLQSFDWDPTSFQKNHLKDYLIECNKFLIDFEMKAQKKS